MTVIKASRGIKSPYLPTIQRSIRHSSPEGVWPSTGCTFYTPEGLNVGWRHNSLILILVRDEEAVQRSKSDCRRSRDGHSGDLRNLLADVCDSRRDRRSEDTQPATSDFRCARRSRDRRIDARKASAG